MRLVNITECTKQLQRSSKCPMSTAAVLKGIHAPLGAVEGGQLVEAATLLAEAPRLAVQQYLRRNENGQLQRKNGSNRV